MISQSKIKRIEYPCFKLGRIEDFKIFQDYEKRYFPGLVLKDYRIPLSSVALVTSVML